MDTHTHTCIFIHTYVQIYIPTYTYEIENNFSKMDVLMRFVKGGRILIAVDSNARSKTWHDVKTNTRGRKLKEYLASKQLHIINEESWST